MFTRLLSVVQSAAGQWLYRFDILSGDVCRGYGGDALDADHKTFRAAHAADVTLAASKEPARYAYALVVIELGVVYKLQGACRCACHEAKYLHLAIVDGLRSRAPRVAVGEDVVARRPAQPRDVVGRASEEQKRWHQSFAACRNPAIYDLLDLALGSEPLNLCAGRFAAYYRGLVVKGAQGVPSYLISVCHHSVSSLMGIPSPHSSRRANASSRAAPETHARSVQPLFTHRSLCPDGCNRLIAHPHIASCIAPHDSVVATQRARLAWPREAKTYNITKIMQTSHLAKQNGPFSANTYIIITILARR